MKTPSLERQLWLESAAKALRGYIRGKGYDVPPNVRVSWGFPKGRHGKERAIGQCWSSSGSSDEHHEIFISPELGNVKGTGGRVMTGVRILDVMLHEFGHSLLPEKVGHGKLFRKYCEAVGLAGEPTATTAGPEFEKWAEQQVKGPLGHFPAGRLYMELKIGKQTTRMIACTCETCGYKARTTRKWIKEAGAPTCGVARHGKMVTDYEPEEDEE